MSMSSVVPRLAAYSESIFLPTEESLWTPLPEEIKIEILTFLPLTQLCPLTRVSKSWRVLLLSSFNISACKRIVETVLTILDSHAKSTPPVPPYHYVIEFTKGDAHFNLPFYNVEISKQIISLDRNLVSLKEKVNLQSLNDDDEEIEPSQIIYQKDIKYLIPAFYKTTDPSKQAIAITASSFLNRKIDVLDD